MQTPGMRTRKPRHLQNNFLRKPSVTSSAQRSDHTKITLDLYGKSQCIPSKEKETPVYSIDTVLAANDFNQFFSSVGRNAAQTSAQLAIDNKINISDTSLILTPMTTNLSEKIFNFTPVTCTQVERILYSMSSPGSEKVSMRIIKDSFPVILGPLTDIINCSFATSTFPNSWKASEVIPLLKDGDHEEPSNNGLLSLLAVASKICKNVALQQFSNYLQPTGLLSKHQSGNRKYQSTEILNIMISDFLLDAMDNKRLSAMILLDLSKPFDSISHSILLEKLSLVAADETTKWFENYLTDSGGPYWHIYIYTSSYHQWRTAGRHFITIFVLYLYQ